MNKQREPHHEGSEEKVLKQTLVRVVLAGVVGWIVVSAGFIGLKMLMQERPQFVGQPGRGAEVELVQGSPRLLLRKVSDDVAIVTESQPTKTQIDFDMKGRRDYRGLQTIMDMTGRFRGVYTISNAYSEAVFVLFKCPHPRADDRSGMGGYVSSLQLEASQEGFLETRGDAWLWTGELSAGESMDLIITYEASNLAGVRYQISEGSMRPILPHVITFRHDDLPEMRFESADGRGVANGGMMIWEREDFLPPEFFSGRIVKTRNLFSSLVELLDIGPPLSLMFLVTAVAGIGFGRSFRPMQVLTIMAGFGLYFPLVVYLSAKFPFPVALLVAVAVPGVLMLNFARWMLGIRVGLIGGGTLLLLYQVFPTLAAFSGWNRGMVLLCLGIVTLFMLIHRQNQSLRRQMVTCTLFGAFCFPVSAQEAQVILPARILESVQDKRAEPLVSLGKATYRVTNFTRYLEIEAMVPFETHEATADLLPLFAETIHLVHSELSPSVRILPETNGMALLVKEVGEGSLRFVYRAAITEVEGRYEARVPLLLRGAGELKIRLQHSDLEVDNGSIWSAVMDETDYRYEVGVAGGEAVRMRWGREHGTDPSRLGDPKVNEVYGIKITVARHLTVIDSGGGSTHFSEFELPSFHPDPFVIGIAEGATLISVSVDGIELESARLVGNRCEVPLGAEVRERRRVSLRLGYAPVRLGFVGAVDLGLPEHFNTAGSLEWSVVFPSGFEAEIVSSGLEPERGQGDLSSFGDYGRVLDGNPRLSLARNLVSPGLIRSKIRYRQLVFDQQK